jgi:hypothetical protein
MSDLPAACPVPVRRRGLRPAERVELALVAASLGAAAALAEGLAWSVPFGTLVGYAAAVLLGQGLVRDVSRLVARRLRGEVAPPTTKLLCLCAESSVGVLLVAAGLGLTLLGIDQPVVVTHGVFVGGLAAVLLFGFVAKDWVLVLRRVEDHAAIRVG